MFTVSHAHSRGQVLVIVALALVALIGFVAFAVDIGFVWGARRRMQTAADAAAMAGAIASRQGYGVTAAAQDAATLNGFTDGTGGVSVTVTSPYTGGSCSSNCVKVAIDQAQPTFFLRVLGFGSFDVKASAVSGTIDSGSCIYTLNQTASPGLKVDGSANVNIPSCGVVVNSTASPAATCNGAATFSAQSIGVAGSASTGCFSPSPTTGTSVEPDPFSYLGSAPTCTANNTSLQITSSQTLNPGYYCHGIQISGANTSVTFSSGTYYLGSSKDLTITAGGTITGTGVTFIDTQGGISISGSGAINLSAPTSGSYKGILFWDTSSSNSSITGGSGSTFDGALYFPNANLKYAGSSSSSGYTIIAAGSVEFTGSTSVGDNYSSIGGSSLIRSSTLYQ